MALTFPLSTSLLTSNKVQILERRLRLSGRPAKTSAFSTLKVMEFPKTSSNPYSQTQQSFSSCQERKKERSGWSWRAELGAVTTRLVRKRQMASLIIMKQFISEESMMKMIQGSSKKYLYMVKTSTRNKFQTWRRIFNIGYPKWIDWEV